MNIRKLRRRLGMWIAFGPRKPTHSFEYASTWHVTPEVPPTSSKANLYETN